MQICIAAGETKRYIHGPFLIHGNFGDLRFLAKKIMETVGDKGDDYSTWIEINNVPSLEAKFLGVPPKPWEL